MLYFVDRPENLSNLFFQNANFPRGTVNKDFPALSIKKNIIKLTKHIIHIHIGHLTIFYHLYFSNIPPNYLIFLLSFLKTGQWIYTMYKNLSYPQLNPKNKFFLLLQNLFKKSSFVQIYNRNIDIRNAIKNEFKF